MSELYGNPEQVSELSGNSEQLPYTPTTEWVIAGWMKARASDGITADIAIEEINRWIAEVEQKAWNRGYLNGYSKGQLDD